MRRRSYKYLVLAVFLLLPGSLFAQAIPDISLPVIDGIRSARNGEEASTSLMLIMLVTFLSLAPAIIMMMTSFTKVVIVFDFVRRALSLQNMPPNQVLFGLAIFLTIFIMAPTIQEFNKVALNPYLNGDGMTTTEFVQEGVKPFRSFMIRQIGKDGASEIALFVEMSGKDRNAIKSVDDIDTYILIPAFMLSEIKKAFIIGIVIFVPFIVIDLVVASTLMSMGMIMLPPAMISLPFKIILFILVDGWHLITYNLVLSYSA
ncbi:MAG TPA: flagellar biosynthetic protein FliP [Leptospiraceae bacterium]|mgnify:CR=1 FL=1|nr:flagellar biosynthetic protein FliP [Spirochaetaceae bacterium]HBS05862.1 flagellar biosynthetic protein FliP [Leptospiraceae bacterium]|tara:strand:- start:19744 stop:20523 length:780 start_codon:yes stop_codon:yes gene_type:complete